MKLTGDASTNSRGKRPLLPGAVSARTIRSYGVSESVRFDYLDGRGEIRDLLSWVGGQWGGLFGSPIRDEGNKPLPESIQKAVAIDSLYSPGSYGHNSEYKLSDALGLALDGLFTSDSLSCRFGLNGKDGLDAAARIARAATGRNYISAHYGYHGAGESWVHAPYPLGIPEAYQELSLSFNWGDVERMRECAKIAAAVCVDVPALDDEEITPFLKEIRQACDEFGSIFILDEVVTGFRLALGGAAEWYGVKPDIACYGKAMSATGCVSAIVGRSDLVDMLGDGRVFHSLTFGGHPGNCAVAAATMNWLHAHKLDVYGDKKTTGDGYYHIPGHLYQIGKALKDGLNQVFIEKAIYARCIGQPERSVLVFEEGDDKRREWCGKMIEKGFVLDRPQFPTLIHTMQDVKNTLAAARSV